MVIVENIGKVQLITLDAPNKHNPFSLALENSIKDALNRANRDNDIHAVIVYGGKNRSFSAGGDFNEVKNLHDSQEIENWIDRVIDLYQTVLKMDKPTIAAIDGYAIGMGFQFALMFDQRLMSSTAELLMPELRHGIGCSVGAAILAHTHSFSTMQEIIYQCLPLNAEKCLEYRLVNKITEEDLLPEEAICMAKIMADYPTSAFINTKRAVNKPFIELLERTRSTSKAVHKASFQARDAQKHFAAVLGQPH